MNQSISSQPFQPVSLSASILALALTWFTIPSSLATAAEKPSSGNASGNALPIRGLHLGAPAKKDLPAALQFIREVLPREGVNTLILEFDYNFDFQSRPEFTNASALGKTEAQELSKACREHQITLIPQINCLG